MTELQGWRWRGDVVRLPASLTCPQGPFVTRPQLCDVGVGLVSAHTHPGLSCLRAAVRSVTDSQGSVT